MLSKYIIIYKSQSNQFKNECKMLDTFFRYLLKIYNTTILITNNNVSHV